MDSFFVYSHSTVSNSHRFPYKLTNIHDRVISINRITSQYRLFVITLDSIYHYHFIFTCIHSLKTCVKDARFIIICPGSKDQLLCYLQKEHQDKMINWVVSINLAKQLQIYQTDEDYYGPFLLEVHSNNYWQLIRHIQLNEGLDWLTLSLLTTRQESEQRALACLKKCQTILVPLVKNQNIKVKVVSWGWTVCPLEIQYSILDQMSIPDIIHCAQALQNYDIIIITWIFRQFEIHRSKLYQFMDLPVKLLDYHENQLSWLLFQWQRFTCFK